MTLTPELLLQHSDAGTLWPAQDRDAGNWPDLEVAYRDALAVRALREKRGEQPVGFKVGFTNRTIWERYGVFAPIWGTVWNTTLTRAEGDEGRLSLAQLAQPRLEPEVVFGMRSSLRRTRSPACRPWPPWGWCCSCSWWGWSCVRTRACARSSSRPARSAR